MTVMLSSDNLSLSINCIDDKNDDDEDDNDDNGDVNNRWKRKKDTTQPLG